MGGSDASGRADEIVTIEAICILGRGIERVSTRSGPVWRPTRYIERPSPSGGHSGYRYPAAMDDASALIAGSHANVLAACTLYDRMRQNGATPRLVAFAAGRPGYLDADPDTTLTEGKILREAFTRRVRVPAEETEIMILAENRNTRDDIDRIAALAGERSITAVAMITVRVHIPRAAEFGRLARTFDGPVRLDFVAAEDLLQERYARHPGILRALDQAVRSAAYERTAAREANGVRALLTGTYGVNI